MALAQALTAALRNFLAATHNQALTPTLSPARRDLVGQGEREKAGVGTTPLRGEGGISGGMIPCGRWCEGLTKVR